MNNLLLTFLDGEVFPCTADCPFSRLRLLSDACDGWIVFDEDTEETFIDLDAWRKMYADRIESMERYTT